MTVREWAFPRVLAHRCGGSLAPENSLAGLAVAASLGCRGVEFDVMLSGDGTPVLIHDETLERTTNGSGRVAATADEALFALDAGSRFDPRFRGERIPALPDALNRCRALGLALNLEIKPSAGMDEATAEAVVAGLRRHWRPAAPPVLVSSFSRAALRRVAAIAPELPLGVLVERMPADWRERCAEVNAVSLNPRHSGLDADVVGEVRAAGLRIACYTVNDAARARALFAWGVDCVITDRPDLIRANDGGASGV